MKLLNQIALITGGSRGIGRATALLFAREGADIAFCHLDDDSQGEATLQVLRGHVRLTTGDDAWEGKTGDYVAVPRERHALNAVEDSVIMLTVLKSIASDQ